MFTLALAGEADLGSMNRCASKQIYQVRQDGVWLAYAIAGLKEVAGELTANESADAPSSSFETAMASRS